MNQDQSNIVELPKGKTGRIIPNFIILEEKIIEAIKTANSDLDVQEFEWGEFPTNLKHIAVNTDLQSIDTTTKGMNQILLSANLVLTIIIFKATKSAQRRQVALPLALGLLKLLSFQDFGLEMKRLIPMGMTSANTEELNKNGFYAMQLKFKAQWYLFNELDEDRTEIQSPDSIRNLSGGPVGDLFKIFMDFNETNTPQKKIVDHSVAEMEN